MVSDNVRHIGPNKLTIGIDQLESFDASGNAGPGVTKEIAIVEVKRLVAEIELLRAAVEHEAAEKARIISERTSALARVEQLEGVVQRLGSSEAMTVSFAIDKNTNEGRELDARLTFAREAQ